MSEINTDDITALEKWLITYNHLLNRKAIEQELGLPVNTLAKLATLERRLPLKHHDKIKRLLRRMVNEMPYLGEI